MKLWPLGIYRVAGHSMEPAFRAGDLVLGWRWFIPKPGQVVIANASQPLIKRIQRLEGGRVYLAGDNPHHFGPNIKKDQLEAVVFFALKN